MADTRSIWKPGIGVLQRPWTVLLALPSYIGTLTTARGRAVHEHAALHKLLASRGPGLRRCAIGGAIAACVAVISATAFWWRLASGPLSVDAVTPWLTAAIEERFGGQRRVEVGGTQIELTEEGNTALRLRDIVVRDRDGAVVASAPKAEVGISGTSLMLGSIKPQRLSLIGAAMAVRIESDGRVTVFAGADKRPIAISPPRPLAPADHAPEGTVSAKSVPAAGELAVLLGWLDQLDALGLDGRGLTEIGLKNGSLIVDDRRSGKQLAFENINLSLTRSRDSGVAFAINSTGADGPWSLAATVTPRSGG